MDFSEDSLNHLLGDYITNKSKVDRIDELLLYFDNSPPNYAILYINRIMAMKYQQSKEDFFLEISPTSYLYSSGGNRYILSPELNYQNENYFSNLIKRYNRSMFINVYPYVTSNGEIQTMHDFYICTLDEFIKFSDDKDFMISIFNMLISLISELHKIGIAHLGLNLSNVVIMPNRTVKFIDFSSAKFIGFKSVNDVENLSGRKIGTFTMPIVQVTYTTDVYLAGCILCSLLLNENFHYYIYNSKGFHRITDKLEQVILPENMHNLLSECLYLSEDRITSFELANPMLKYSNRSVSACLVSDIRSKDVKKLHFKEFLRVHRVDQIHYSEDFELFRNKFRISTPFMRNFLPIYQSINVLDSRLIEVPVFYDDIIEAYVCNARMEGKIPKALLEGIIAKLKRILMQEKLQPGRLVDYIEIFVITEYHNFFMSNLSLTKKMSDRIYELGIIDPSEIPSKYAIILK